MQLDTGSQTLQSLDFPASPSTLDKLDKTDRPAVANRPDTHAQRSCRFPFAFTSKNQQQNFGLLSTSSIHNHINHSVDFTKYRLHLKVKKDDSPGT